MSVGSVPGTSSAKQPSPPSRWRDDEREQIIDAALELFSTQGYDSTTLDHVAASVGLTPAEVTKHFSTTNAVLMSIVEAMSRATAAALTDVEKGTAPERALLHAGTAALTAVIDGHGATTLKRLLAMARLVTISRDLHRLVSASRRRVLAPALADWMGVDLKNQRLQRALTMWSAVNASAYVESLDIPGSSGAQRRDRLRRQMIANLSQSYSQVMGEDPTS